MGAAAHHRLVWPGVQKGWLLRAALELNPHPSGRSFWRNCDLRQPCLLWGLPTARPGLWVLGHPEHQHSLGGAKFEKTGLKTWKD